MPVFVLMICMSAPGITVRRESVTLPVRDALVDWERKTDGSTRIRSKRTKAFSRLVRAGIRLGKAPPGQAYCMNPPSPATWAESGNRAASQAPEHTYDTRRRSVPLSRAIFFEDSRARKVLAN